MSTRVMKRWRTPGLVMGALGAMALTMSACTTQSERPAGTNEAAPAVNLPELPTYAEVASRHNASVERIKQFKGAATLRIDFLNDKGDRQREQGEGRIQLIKPDRLALDIGKVSTTVFWLGSDSDRYWWLDMSGDKRYAFVGQHAKFDPDLGRRIGIVVAPMDLIRLLGIVPLAESGGRTFWSRDGALLGVESALVGGAKQRTWFEPATLQPRQIELYDAKGKNVLSAQLENFVAVELVAPTTNPPKVPGRIRVYHAESKSLFILDIDDLRDDHISTQAFDLPFLVQRMRIDQIVDLDSRVKPRAK
jgi:outer membrane lipoprotein-sorting protein